MNLAHLYSVTYLAQDPDDTGGQGGSGITEVNNVIDNGISMVTMVSTGIAVLCFSLVGVLIMLNSGKEGGLRKNLGKAGGVAIGAAVVGAAAIAPIFIELGQQLTNK